MTIETQDVEPVLTNEQLRSLEYQLLDPSHGRLITTNTKIFCGGKLKALFLKADTVSARVRDKMMAHGVRPDPSIAPATHRPQYREGVCGPIPEVHYRAALNALQKMKFYPASATRRSKAVKQSKLGKDLVLGWMGGLRRDYEDLLKAQNRDQFFLAMRLVPLIRDFQWALQQHLPDYWSFHLQQARKLVRPPDERLKSLNMVRDAHQKQMLKQWDTTEYYHFMGVEGISSLTLNCNIVFGAHADGNNMNGTLGCLTALGDYAGGALCFPRLGVAFDLRPRDLLIADTNEEFHGSCSPIFGTRYSVVAYLHGSLDKGLRPAYDQQGKLKGVAKVTDRNKRALRRVRMQGD